MKVGSVGFATSQGLGFLLKDFYDNGVITDVYPIEHRSYKNHGWYGESHTRIHGLKSFCLDMDVMFFFETTFDPQIISFCRAHNILTILMPMYECSPSYSGLNRPDVVISPSELDYMHYPEGTYIPVPIPKWIKWKERNTANVFVHNAGNGGLKGRNGTKELLQAMEYVKSDIKLIVRCQDSKSQRMVLQEWKRVSEDHRIVLKLGEVPKEELYDEGDVFIFPERFNGLSLPLQEAKASGMAIMCLDRFPMNRWNKRDLLIEPEASLTTDVVYQSYVQMHNVDPKKIAAKIDEWAGKDITEQSHRGKEFGEALSWDNVKPDYTSTMIAATIRNKPL